MANSPEEPSTRRVEVSGAQIQQAVAEILRKMGGDTVEFDQVYLLAFLALGVTGLRQTGAAFNEVKYSVEVFWTGQPLQ